MGLYSCPRFVYNETMPRFVLKLKDKVLSEITVRKTLITIGRDKGNDIHLDNPAVSRFHAKIEKIGDHPYYIDDLKSTNGTFVNEKKVSWRTGLRDNDIITIGKYSLIFYEKDASDPLVGPAGIDATIRVN